MFKILMSALNFGKSAALLKFHCRNISKSFSKQPKRTSNACVPGISKAVDSNSRGLVLGLYADPEDKLDFGVFTATGWRYNQKCTDNRLADLLRTTGPMPKSGECRVLFDVDENFTAVAVCGLGRECMGYDCNEEIDEWKESIRRASAIGCSELQKLQTSKIYVESFGHAESAAEGAGMGVWTYQELKSKKNQIYMPQIEMFVEPGVECDYRGWSIGMEKATAQNFTRQLQERPANLLTPSSFAQHTVEALCKSGVNVEIKVKGWIESQKMHSYLAVSKSSCESPIFLELSYYGTSRKEQPIVLIGQGITYDTGGLFVKPEQQLQKMRGDMTGAAVVVATCRAIACLNLPINIRGLVPLCESSIGAAAMKPGDVIKTMNGKCIEVQRTDMEDTLVMSDAIHYAQHFSPKFIVDIGTTSNQVQYTLGEAASAVFTNSEVLWEKFKNASIHTGDRVWRFPLWNYFTRQIKSSKVVDIQNHGLGKGGEPCKAAALLKEFLPCGQWLHVDAMNVVETDGKSFEYLRKGMAGRPTRTLIEFIAQLCCPAEHQKPNEKQKIRAN